MRHVAQLPDETVNYTQKSHIRWFLRLLLGLTLVTAAVYVGLGLLAEQLALSMSPQTEKELLGFAGRLYPDGEDADDVDAYLQGIVDKLTAQLPEGDPYGIQVRLTCGPEVNAGALPGGSIILFSPLYDLLETENELAFILAHEVAHVVHRDSVRRLGRSVVPLLLSGMLGLAGDASIGSMSSSALKISELKYSRDREESADQLGLLLLNKAYGHAGGAVQAFRKMAGEESPYLGWVPEMASTHPDTMNRIKSLIRIIEHRGYVEEPPIPKSAATHRCSSPELKTDLCE